MRFVPLHFTDLEPLFPIWFPFISKISARSKEPVKDLLRQIKEREVEIALVWDGTRAHALVGIRYRQRGEDCIGEIVWLTGNKMKEWRDLLPDMEAYLK